MSETATITGQAHTEVAFIAARAALACATFSLCIRWLGVAEASDTSDGEPAPFVVDGVEAFVRAWVELVKVENPQGVIEVAVDGIIADAGWPNDMNPKVRAMFLSGLIGPIVAGVTAKLTGEPRLAGLGACLEALRQADAADDGEPSAATMAALESTRQSLQDAAERGVSGAHLQRVLDVWANATGGPRVTVQPVQAG